MSRTAFVMCGPAPPVGCGGVRPEAPPGAGGRGGPHRGAPPQARACAPEARLEPGRWGRISSVEVKPGKWLAQARFRGSLPPSPSSWDVGTEG